MFSRLFGAKDRKEPASPAAAQLPILVRQSVFDNTDDKAIVSALIDEYINPLIERGQYLRSELPANAMRAYHTDYYLAQVANGGHGQFMHNSRMQPLILQDIREGLAAIAIEPYVGIFKDFETFLASDPKRATAVAGNAGFGTPDLTEAELDKRFFAARCYETLMPAYGRWLKGLPELKVVPDAEFKSAIESLVAANPRAEARRLARNRQRFSLMLQDTLQVAARLLGFQKSILPVRIGGGSPGAKTPDGRSAVGWAIGAQQGQFTMFVLEDAVLLCEEYLPDGRRITRELMREVYASLTSKSANPEATKGFDQKIWKEVCRIPIATVEDAKQVAKDGNVLAAAEIACARLQDELVDLHALSKNRDGIWCFALWGKAAQYLMHVHEQGMIITKLAEDGSKAEPLGIRLEEILGYKTATAGGHA